VEDVERYLKRELLVCIRWCSSSELVFVEVPRVVLQGWFNFPIIFVLRIVSNEQKALSKTSSCDVTGSTLSICIIFELLHKTVMYIVVEDVIFGRIS
jgi:hypothetical protein